MFRKQITCINMLRNQKRTISMLNSMIQANMFHKQALQQPRSVMSSMPRAMFSTEESFDYIKNYSKPEDWEEVMERTDKPTLVQAGAAWCGPCTMLKPLLLSAIKG